MGMDTFNIYIEFNDEQSNEKCKILYEVISPDHSFIFNIIQSYAKTVKNIDQQLSTYAGILIPDFGIRWKTEMTISLSGILMY